MRRGVRLVINADDFGYSQERDQGIVECFQKSVISSASLMVNGLHAVEAAEWSKTFILPLGLHLNLTEGLPIGSQSYPTLVDKDGTFRGKFGLREAMKTGAVQLSEVRCEIENQIERFHQLLGYLPYHVDGHQHIHLCPDICEIFAEILHNRGISVTRLPNERHFQECDWIDSDRMTFYKEVIQQSSVCASIFEKYNIRFAPAFVGISTCGADMTVDRLISALTLALNERSDLSPVTGDDKKSQTIQVCELMVHPGYPTGNSGGCGSGPDEFSQSSERKREMDVLLSPEFKKYLNDNDTKLCSFREAFQGV